MVLRGVAIRAWLPIQSAMLRSFLGLVTYNGFTVVFGALRGWIRSPDSIFLLLDYGVSWALIAGFIPCTYLDF